MNERAVQADNLINGQKPDSDQQLVAAAIDHGPKAFATIVERYQDAVFGIALARLHNFQAAEDVAQEVFVAAFERLGDLKDPSRLGAWLRSISIHMSIRFLRRQRETTETTETVSKQTDDGPSPHAELEKKELRFRVLGAIEKLSKTQRETTTLYYVNGYSVAEVAAIQEVPVGTVKGRLYDAREKLKAEMMNMVADVLKSEAPKEDLAQRVFDVLSQRGKHGHEIMVELRQLGADGAIDGFLKAAESSQADTRRHAVDLVGLFDAPEYHDKIAELLKRCMRDTNQNVRGGAIRAAIEYFACGEQRKRNEFVPLIVELLFDSAKAVRASATFQLQRGWVADKAAQASLEEPNRVVQKAKESLLRAVLDAQALQPEPAMVSGQGEERLVKLKQKLMSSNSSVRAFAVPALLYLPMSVRRKREEVVPLAVGMLKDRSKRVRRRAAYELCGWAADVPIDTVEKACRAEIDAGTRQVMQHLLRKATDVQESTTR